MKIELIKNITCILLAFVIIFSSVLLPFSQNVLSQSSSDNLGKVCVLVDYSKYGGLQPELNTYKNDLEKEGYVVEINATEFSDHIEVRNYLKNEWLNNELVGCVIVGDLPFAWYEISNEGYLPYNYSNFPVDYFYTDLDGEWIDNNPHNGIYDNHLSGLGDLEPEIWLGRITINSQWENDTELIKNYFIKNHDYREGNLSVPHRALLYIDDDVANYSSFYEYEIGPIYSNYTLVNNIFETNAVDYMSRLEEGYEWVNVWCHANLSSIKHSFEITDGIDNNGNNIIDEKGDGGIVYSSDIQDLNPKALFYNIQTCSAANFSTSDYLCGWYAFSESYGLCVIGSTRPQLSFDYYDMYASLSEEKNIGESYKHWFDGIVNYYEDEIRGYYYGMTIIGDPTLKPLYRDNNPTNDDDGDGVPDNLDVAPLNPNITDIIDDGATNYIWFAIVLALIAIVVGIIVFRRKPSKANKHPEDTSQI